MEYTTPLADFRKITLNLVFQSLAPSGNPACTPLEVFWRPPRGGTPPSLRITVLDDLHGSDHFPVILTTGDAIPVTRAPRWCTDKANWPPFEELSHIEVDANEMQQLMKLFFI